MRYRISNFLRLTGRFTNFIIHARFLSLSSNAMSSHKASLLTLPPEILIRIAECLFNFPLDNQTALPLALISFSNAHPTFSSIVNNYSSAIFLYEPNFPAPRQHPEWLDPPGAPIWMFIIATQFLAYPAQTPPSHVRLRSTEVIPLSLYKPCVKLYRQLWRVDNIPCKRWSISYLRKFHPNFVYECGALWAAQVLNSKCQKCYFSEEVYTNWCQTLTGETPRHLDMQNVAWLRDMLENEWREAFGLTKKQMRRGYKWVMRRFTRSRGIEGLVEVFSSESKLVREKYQGLVNELIVEDEGEDGVLWSVRELERGWGQHR